MNEYTASSKGLTSEEVKKRLDRYGYNEISEKKQPAYLKFLSYLWGPIPWMIEAALILSIVVQDWVDFAIIFSLLIVNAIVGFIEEYQADSAINDLKKNLAIKAKAYRDGKWQNIASRELVPDDLINLRMGNVIPADSELKGKGTIKIDESALTGESLPVDKHEGDTIYSGSTVKQGEMTARVTATGKNTYFGKTASLIEEADTVSHFQKTVLKIGNYLIIIAIVLVAIILTVSIFRGDEFLRILKFSLVLTIAAIPVAMPTVLSVTMAVGAKLLSKKRVIVRKLSAIEELAGIDTLCSDKTGTLTKNELTFGDPYLMDNISKENLIFNAALASKEEDEDPIDNLVLSELHSTDTLKKYKIKNFIPFDPSSKRTEAEVEDESQNQFKVSKGAPQVIMNLAVKNDETKKKITDKIDEYASKGYRTLGVAKTDINGDWNFLGILSLFDPPRDDSEQTLKNIQDYGIKVKMITGD
ncbi:MAG TPA: plasma-membrane proton-efflux P-type ATPase, partial [Bacteroidales bacterium]|nr:plasma-membrane proton-efflux P-type ATPase [Bacteroidales bacterium]